MYKERHEKRLNKLLNYGKKNRVLKYPILILVFFEIAFFHLQMKLIKNSTKIVCCFSLLFFVFIFGSFIFKGNNKNQVIVQNTYDSTNTSYELNFTSNDIEEGNVISDVATDEDSDNTNLESGEDDEFYSIDDFIDEDYNKDFVSLEEGGSQEISVDDFNSDDWNLILINKQHPIPENYDFELGDLKAGMKCDKRVVPYLMNMLAAAKEDGVSLVICSPYRNNDRQVMLFNKKISNYMKKGYSYVESYQMTSQAVTVPGSSEHQAGLAFDIVTKGYALLNEGFASTEAGIWLRDNSYKYGFIIRYPKGKEDITGIEYEPWHFRYVGMKAAKYITENNLTLEEFCELIEE